MRPAVMGTATATLTGMDMTTGTATTMITTTAMGTATATLQPIPPNPLLAMSTARAAGTTTLE